MKSFRIRRIFGIDIEVHWSLIIIVGLVAQNLAGMFEGNWLAAIATALIFIFSALFHEVAHSLAAKRFGIEVKRITLFILGGMAHLETEPGFGSPRKEFFISIAGPLSSLFLVVIFYVLAVLLLSHAFLLYASAFYWLCIINIIFAGFNILPIFPMDGGRVFRAILWWKTKNLVKATKIAVNLSIVLAISLPIAGFFLDGIFGAIWLGLIALFIIIMARAEYRSVLRGPA